MKFASLLAILLLVAMTYACDSQTSENREETTTEEDMDEGKTTGMSSVDMSEEPGGMIMAIEPPTFIADSMGTARITVTNNTRDVLTFGEQYYVEESSNGEWTRLNYLDDVAFNDIGIEVQAGESREMNVDMRTGDYTFKKGLYRLCKDLNMAGKDTTLCTQFRVE